MQDKSQTDTLLQNFCNKTQRHFLKPIQVIRSDNGLEFKSKPMRAFYYNQAIIHQTSFVGAPQKNGRVERKHHHILEVARSLRFHTSTD